MQRCRFRGAAKMLAEAEEILRFTTFLWRPIWSNNPQERLNREIRRRTHVLGISPDQGSIIRIVGEVLCELNDDTAVVRRYMTIEPGGMTAAVIRAAQERFRPARLTNR